MNDQQIRIFKEIAKAMFKDIGLYVTYEDRMEELLTATALYMTGNLNKIAFIKFMQTREYFNNYDFQQNHLDSILIESRKYMERF